MKPSTSIPLFLAALHSFSLPVNSYRIFDYQGDKCNGAELNVHRLAGPSACTSLNIGITQSVFIKIDNIHDDQYDVVLHSSDSCDGRTVGLIHNTNGCLPADVPGFGKAHSICVVQTSSQTKKLCRADEELESDLEYNMDSLREGTIQSPISPGVFVTIKKEDHDEDGFFTSDLAAEYNVPDMELVNVNGTLLAYEGSAVSPLHLQQ
ncbi:hypothetical protein AnigIFM62618_011106 [Aspergillus niger]|nr:hypothetical protein AnigIFM62618_011106 [Aspergillus niger]